MEDKHRENGYGLGHDPLHQTHAQNSAEAAKTYIERGLAPIPIPGGSKNPDRRNWQKERWTLEDVPRLWNNGQNVGILCGSPSNGRKDVDCDCPEAVRLAPKFLTPTLKGGRDTVPGSHWWYVSPGCPTQAFLETDGKRILELRGDGCQTLVFPSVHPDDGDVYRWYTDMSPDMAEVDAAGLQHQVRLLYTAALIARHMPPIGARHDYANALAGFLLRNERVPEEDVRRAMRAAWELFPDAGADALRDVDNSVSTTLKRIKEKKPVRGGGALALYDERLTKTLADGWGWQLADEEDTAYGWSRPEELPANLPPVPRFEYHMLPNAFRSWVQDISERMQVPPDFVAAPLMVAFGSVVGRKVGIQPKRHDDWTVVPNLWGGIVGSPGLMKSPALEQALAPIKALAHESKERYKEALSDYETQLEKYQAKVAAYESKKKTLAKGGDEKALEEHIDNNHPGEPPEPPAERRYRTDDTTVEKLGELLNQNPNGIMVFRDELVGFMRNLEKYGRDGDRQFYLEGWGGNQPYNVDRIGRGTLHIQANCLSILGGIQPGPLSQYVHDAGQGTAGDDGFLQRFQVLVYPDPAQEWRNVDRYPNHEAKNTVTDVFKFADNSTFGTAEDGSIPYLKFSPGAQQIFDAWRGELEAELRSGDLSPALESHKSKYRSLLPTLALLIELADSAARGEKPEYITELSIGRAGAWVDYLEGHAKRVYYSAERPEVRSSRELLKKLKRGEVAHGDQVREVYRKQWSGLQGRRETLDALEVLEDYGWLRLHSFATGGRQGEVILLNPALRDGIRRLEKS